MSPPLEATPQGSSKKEHPAVLVLPATHSPVNAAPSIPNHTVSSERGISCQKCRSLSERDGYYRYRYSVSESPFRLHLFAYLITDSPACSACERLNELLFRHPDAVESFTSDRYRWDYTPENAIALAQARPEAYRQHDFDLPRDWVGYLDLPVWRHSVLLSVVEDLAFGSRGPEHVISYIMVPRPDLGRISKMLKDCTDNHPYDNLFRTDGEMGETNLRVIDCTLPLPRVIPAPTTCRYAALSYVWGSSSATDDHVSDDGTLLNLPLTVRDAIDVTRNLELNYLWVDRYCINQGDTKDKQDQIQNMDMIYHRADVAIIAAAGENPDYGLPGVSVRRRYQPPSKDVAQSIERSKWNTRAWTYQEAVLSPRQLYFTDHDTLFQCASGQCFLYEGRKPDLLPKISVRLQKSFMTAHIERFSKRSLTYDSDVFNAISAIFRAYRRLSDEKQRALHFCGVPLIQRKETDSMTTQLVRGFLWMKKLAGPRRNEFPSWSWLGWTGGVSWLDSTRFDVHREVDIRIRLEDAEGKNVDVDSYDFSTAPLYPPFHPRLTIKGTILTTRLLRHKGLRFISGIYETYRVVDVVSILCDIDLTDPTLSGPQEFLVLLDGVYLLLRPLESGHYERVGIFDQFIHNETAFLEDRWPEVVDIWNDRKRRTETITLV